MCIRYADTCVYIRIYRYTLEIGKSPYLISYIILYQDIVVRPSVCDGCGRGRNGFAGRVQNHHVRFSFHVHRTILIFLEIV